MAEYSSHCHTGSERVNEQQIAFEPDLLNSGEYLFHDGTGPEAFEDVKASSLLKAASDPGGTRPAWRPGTDTAILWLLPTDELPLPLELLTGLLDADERARADRFHFDLHRKRFIAAHALTRLVLSACGAGEARELRFVKGASGKPRLFSLAGSAPALSFNLSHSGSWALLAVAMEGDLGVDIEEIRSFDDFESLARNTFSPAETGALLRLPEASRLEGFFACWARKESLIKADGRGLGVPLDGFEVNVSPDQPARLLKAEGDAAAVARFTLRDIPSIPDYRAALAAPHEIHQCRFFRIGP